MTRHRLPPCLLNKRHSAALSCRQKERNQQQQAAFDRALQSMDLLYAHQETMVWRMTRLLDGYPSAKPYSDRGWVCGSVSLPS